MPAPSLSIIIPVLDEAAAIGEQLEALQGLRAQGAELIVVDGGSRDGTPEIASGLADQVIVCRRGRAVQMNSGAQIASGETLLFLHADTRLPPEARASIHEAIGAGAIWGRFDVHIDGTHPLLRVVETMMNLRSRLTAIATGDQAIFVRSDRFKAIGGYPELALMEDIALCATLKKIAAPACLRQRVITSGRRWEKKGVVRTILLMWRLRAAYFFGANPDQLALRYGYRPPRR